MSWKNKPGPGLEKMPWTWPRLDFGQSKHDKMCQIQAPLKSLFNSTTH